MPGRGSRDDACSKVMEAGNEWGGLRGTPRPDHARRREPCKELTIHSRVRGKLEQEVKLGINVTIFTSRNIPQEIDQIVCS